MVIVNGRRCLHDSCMKRPVFNIEGSKTASYCRQHAEDGMVNVSRRSCSHDPCMKRPTFNMEGNKTAVYCRTHAKDGMVEVSLSRRCSNITCARRPTWGLLADGTASVCYYHKGDVLGDPVINFEARCKVAGCRKVSSWGLEGNPPTHCGGHGPVQDGLVCTVTAARRKRSCPSTSYHNKRRASSHLKVECSF